MQQLEEKSGALPAGNRRTGGRSARVRQAVLESALVELTTNGYANFSMGNVARRAEVHETTVYRRWPQREDLIIDACMHFADTNLPVPDTGDMARDLTIAITNLVHMMETPLGQVLVSLGFSARAIPEFSKPSLAFWQARIGIGQRVVQQAIARGDWPKAYDSAALFAELIGPLLARHFLLQEKITPAMIAERVAAVMALGKPAGLTVRT